jgi:hypothetical protein
LQERTEPISEEYLSGTHSLAGSWLYLKTLETRLEKFAREKRYSLLQKLVDYGGKKFYNVGPWRENAPASLSFESVVLK